MSDPVSAGLLLAASVAGAVGSIQQGIAGKRSADFNARMARLEANRRAAEGKLEEDQARRDASRIRARATALVGGSGITFAGTPLLTDLDLTGKATLEALKIRSRTSADVTRLRNQAALFKSQGSSALISGFIRAGTTLLTGGSKFAGSFGSPGGGGFTAPAAPFGPGDLGT